jgi:cytochrome c553
MLSRIIRLKNADRRVLLHASLPFVIAIILSGCQVGAASVSSHGKDLFQTCVPCHGEAGQGNAAVGAPNIAGMSAPYLERQLQKFRTGVRGANFDDTEGLRMRPMSLALSSDQDVKAVAAYVASLPPQPQTVTSLSGNPQTGKVLYTTCGACHGPAGAGNEALKAPRIAGTDDWYLATQLRKFKKGIRGSSSKDAEGAMMRPMAGTLRDEAAIQNVVAYIETLKH